jgi:hypothetical protein
MRVARLGPLLTYAWHWPQAPMEACACTGRWCCPGCRGGLPSLPGLVASTRSRQHT